LSSPDARLNLIAQRQLQALGRIPGYLADRMEILNSARGWLITEQGDEEPDVMDILSVAEFLAGDRITES
jgi:hypothetical protein